MNWESIPEWSYTVANALLQAVKEKDVYTYGHCKRVAQYAKLLAEAAGFSEYEQKIIEFSSLFHDLGKIGIPDHILLKPDKLTEQEEAIMRSHPIKSAEIITPLAHIPFFRATLSGIRHHHERIDGDGYPDGIKGNHIPLSARLILVVDTFDAMTTSRPYRHGLPPEIAYKELKQFAGRQFDSQFVKIFLEAHPKWHLNIEEMTQEELVAPEQEKSAPKAA